MADSKLTALSEVSVPALEDLLYLVDDPSGTPTSVKVSANRALGLLNHICQGRLTLESGVPVSTSDQTGKTSIYFTPYGGNKIAVYDGTRWKLYSFSELTFALGTLSDATNYDLFVYDNSGTLTLEATAWTNDTTRATALTTQDGVYVKNGATTRRYLGTFRTTATTTTEDSVLKRYLWNAYNRHPRKLARVEGTDSWTYATSTWRQANGSTSNKVEFVTGLAGAFLDLNVTCFAGANGSDGRIALALDSTTTPDTNSSGGYVAYLSASTPTTQTMARLATPVAAVGYHYAAWLEYRINSTVTFYGDAGLASLLGTAGIAGWVDG